MPSLLRMGLLCMQLLRVPSVLPGLKQCSHCAPKSRKEQVWLSAAKPPTWAQVFLSSLRPLPARALTPQVGKGLKCKLPLFSDCLNTSIRQ